MPTIQMSQDAKRMIYRHVGLIIFYRYYENSTLAISNKNVKQFKVFYLLVPDPVEVYEILVLTEPFFKIYNQHDFLKFFYAFNESILSEKRIGKSLFYVDC